MSVAECERRQSLGQAKKQQRKQGEEELRGGQGRGGEKKGRGTTTQQRERTTGETEDQRATASKQSNFPDGIFSSKMIFQICLKTQIYIFFSVNVNFSGIMIYRPQS